MKNVKINKTVIIKFVLLGVFVSSISADIFSAEFSSNEKKAAYDFFIQEAKKETKIKKYQYNEYENIIGGICSFTIGNLGYFLSDSEVLKLAYSGVQTLGIINIGQGIYDYYAPDETKSFYKFVTSVRNVDVKGSNVVGISNNRQNPEYELSWNMLEYYAKKEIAKRKSLLYTSSFLTLQYSLNITLGNPPGALKNVYYFMGGVNLVIALYSYFKIDKYETYYNGVRKNNFSLSNFDLLPVFDPVHKNSGMLASFRYQF